LYVDVATHVQLNTTPTAGAVTVAAEESTVPSESSHWYVGAGLPPVDEQVIVVSASTSGVGVGVPTMFSGQPAKKRRAHRPG